MANPRKRTTNSNGAKHAGPVGLSEDQVKFLIDFINKTKQQEENQTAYFKGADFSGNATKYDLALLENKMTLEMNKLNTALKEEMHRLNTALKEEMHKLNAETNEIIHKLIAQTNETIYKLNVQTNDKFHAISASQLRWIVGTVAGTMITVFGAFFAALPYLLKLLPHL
jgi:D-ribose pyranose/furanose isomerase RbsD